MKELTLKICENNIILITTDEDRAGKVSAFPSTVATDEQLLIALATYLKYEPAELLNLDCLEI